MLAYQTCFGSNLSLLPTHTAAQSAAPTTLHCSRPPVLAIFHACVPTNFGSRPPVLATYYMLAYPPILVHAYLCSQHITCLRTRQFWLTPSCARNISYACVPANFNSRLPVLATYLMLAYPPILAHAYLCSQHIICLRTCQFWLTPTCASSISYACVPANFNSPLPVLATYRMLAYPPILAHTYLCWQHIMLAYPPSIGLRSPVLKACGSLLCAL